MPMHNSYAALGTISHGTLRPEDLIPSFMDALDELKDDRSLSDNGEAFKDDYARLTDLQAGMEQRMKADGYFTSEDSMWDIETLTDELQSFAPDYCYFGAIEGDGSDFGFWISWDAIEDARHDGELSSGDQTPEKAEGMFLVVSDHGNAELYAADSDGKWVSVWSCV